MSLFFLTAMASKDWEELSEESDDSDSPVDIEDAIILEIQKLKESFEGDLKKHTDDESKVMNTFKGQMSSLETEADNDRKAQVNLKAEVQKLKKDLRADHDNFKAECVKKMERDFQQFQEDAIKHVQQKLLQREKG
jgi:molecular chaperone GrpE (heat shock protein)